RGGKRLGGGAARAGRAASDPALSRRQLGAAGGRPHRLAGALAQPHGADVSNTLIGGDLGGTSLRAAVATGPVTHDAPVVHPTPARAGPAAVLDAVAACANEAAGGREIDGLAIGIPGPLDPSTGVVHAAPHLAGWREVAAAQELSKRLGCPVAVRNDATLAGLAEWMAGAGQGTRHFVFITTSTG